MDLISPLILVLSLLADGPISTDAPLRREAEVAFTEGPAWHPSGDVYFSDIANDRIMRRDAAGELHVFRRPSGRANGLLLDRQLRLLACEGGGDGGHRRVTRTELDGTITVLAERYEGKRLNSPNDLTIDSRGRVYFTDPRYGDRADVEQRDPRGREVEGVYRIDAPGKIERIITHEVERPNGIGVSPDGRHLYVADNVNDGPHGLGGHRKLWRFDLRADGDVDPASRRLVFDWGTDRGPDGFALDASGRLYVAAGFNHPKPPVETAKKYRAGIYVIEPGGTLVQTLPVPADMITNCAFGGEDRRTLFITAGHKLFSARVDTPGLITALMAAPESSRAIAIGSRRELFVDDALIDRTSGVELTLHRPEPREVSLVTGEPWEGNTSAYYTVFRDGDLFRMYYRGSHWDEKARPRATHREVTCYAESDDGLHWRKPKLGLFEFDGSKENNIVWDGIGTHCFTPFLDVNPDASPDARYKAVARGRPRGKKGLYLFKSPDGVHWSFIESEPVIVEGAFDSQNLAFWDPHARIYREYHRTFVNGVRAIMTGTSTDFVRWTDPVLLEYEDSPNEHLYTNAVRAYERAPHILLGFPTRYLPRENSRVEPVFMSSRDGRHFRRWPTALIPEDAPEDRKGNRSNYLTWGLVSLPGNDRELSVYATEAYYTGPDTRVRRFVFRVDGFVSARGGKAGGDLVSKALTFAGAHLELNYATRPGGGVRVEIQDESGSAIPGFALGDSIELRGDEVAGRAKWRGGDDVSALAGRTVRLRFAIRDADVWAFRFGG